MMEHRNDGVGTAEGRTLVEFGYRENDGNYFVVRGPELQAVVWDASSIVRGASRSIGQSTTPDVQEYEQFETALLDSAFLQGNWPLVNKILGRDK